MSNCNISPLHNLSKSKEALSRSQSLQDIAMSMAKEFAANDCIEQSAYLSLRHLLIASHHLTANAISDLNCLVDSLNSSGTHTSF